MKSEFSRLHFNFRWRDRFRPCDWTIVGISKWWACPESYRYGLHFFGVNVFIWFDVVHKRDRKPHKPLLRFSKYSLKTEVCAMDGDGTVYKPLIRLMRLTYRTKLNHKMADGTFNLDALINGRLTGSVQRPTSKD